jgi:hypothetical protein
VSERVTLTACPRCGGLAAVGWAAVEDSPGEDTPVEFDCPAGCQIILDELPQIYGRQARGPRPDSPA